MKNRRIGYVEVSENLLKDAISTGDGMNMFVGSIPLDINRNYICNIATYTLWNSQFDIVPSCQILPKYKANGYDRNGTPIWEKVND